MTKHLKLMLRNEVWKRKFDYGFSNALESTNPSEIVSASLTVFPRFISGYVNEARIPEWIQTKVGEIPAYLNIQSYKEWSYNNGVAMIEVEYSYHTPEIPTKEDLTEDIMPHYTREFLEKYHRYSAVLKELSAFALAGLHLSFPTESTMLGNEEPLNDGFLQIVSDNRIYATRKSTDQFMHEILIEKDKVKNLENNLEGLATVWHYDLWPLKRYLKAVESNRISMDNLLDLIYALEGLFDKNVSADFVKMTCVASLCKTKREARSMKNFFDVAYKIRNEIAHGGISYDAFDDVKLEGKQILAQDIYWQLKGYVATMLIKAISKLIRKQEMRNLRFTSDDFLDLLFKE